MTGNFAWLVVASCCWFALTGCHDPGPTQTVEPVAVHPADQDLTPTGGKPYNERIQYRAPDAKPAIVEPDLVSAEDAIIAPGTKVIGVFVGGEARAYPLYILNNHQIVNDRVGGIPISASW
ncbi:MAG: DUF3179 domain-containing protein [Planctomycetes bacterium]|nr:DUF3179 domain-containing protein [Planctomycetota bacterium]